jgi:hypothetical protein
MQQNTDLIPQLNQLESLPFSWSDKLAYLTYRFLTMEQTACPVTHHFEPGRYIREMHIPADTLFIGRPHTHGHEVQLISGVVIHLHEGRRILIDKPVSVVTPPGYQMAAYTLTDVVARTVHPNPNESRDVDALENEAFGAVELLRARGEQIARELLTCQA